MSKVLIISATKGNNLQLAYKICDLLHIDNEVISLEEFPFPLYIPKINETMDDDIMNDLCSKFIQSNGLIFCAPEYNGGSPPILINAITWLSLNTKNWRDAFRNKIVLMATHSGGSGRNFLITLRVQLEHLGSVVFPHNIIVNSNKKFNENTVNNILTDFINLL